MHRAESRGTEVQALDAPLAVRNAALLQAGCAPAFHAATLAEPQRELARAALEQLLRAHDPLPALLLDAHWNALQRTQGAQRLWRWLLPDVEATPDAQAVNLLDALVHPQGYGRRILNLAELGPSL